MPRLNCVLLHGLLLLVAGATGCIGGQTGSEARGGAGLGKTEPCEPLGARPEPIELGTVLGVGRDADGTVYVVDRKGDTDYRAFVAEGTTLVRQRVLGSGSDTTETGLERLSLNVESAPRYRLLVEVAADGAKRMARTEGEGKELDIDALSAAERLEMLGADAIDGYALRNLPGEIRIEYFARTEDGKLLVVLVPVDDFAYDKFRLFYGDVDKLEERKLDNVSRAKDGGTTRLFFVLDGEAAEAFFPVQFDGGTFKPGPASLEIGGDVRDLERLDPDADTDLLDGAAFACLKP